MDVADARSVEDGFAEMDRTGRLDIVVNNAGIDVVGRVEDLSEAEWDACLDTNLKGPFLVARQAVPRLRSTGGGVIVNVASNAGVVARADEPAYSTSKAGLLMLTRCLALAHAEDRIRVNAVCPGPVGDTGIMDRNLAQAPDPAAALGSYLRKAPLAAAWGRLIEPREVAALIRFLCSDAAMMITGASIAIDGGKSAAGPALTGEPSAARQNGGGSGGVTTTPWGWTVWRRWGVRRASSSSLGRYGYRKKPQLGP